MEACRVLFEGEVQGVGFRYTALRLADGRPVAGYVLNLSDGRVEMWAQGEGDAVQKFVDDVSARMRRHIVSVTISSETPRPDLQIFEIAHKRPPSR